MGCDKHVITTKVDYSHSSRAIDVSGLLSIGLSGSVIRLSIILSLKSLLPNHYF